MKLQKETHIQALLVRQTIKQIERAKQRLEMQRKELLRLEDECLAEIKADFEKGAFYRIEYSEKDVTEFVQEDISGQIEEGLKVFTTIKTESGYIIDICYYLIDGEITTEEGYEVYINSFYVEVDSEEVELNIEPSEVAKLIYKHYTHEGH